MCSQLPTGRGTTTCEIWYLWIYPPCLRWTVWPTRCVLMSGGNLSECQARVEIAGPPSTNVRFKVADVVIPSLPKKMSTPTDKPPMGISVYQTIFTIFCTAPNSQWKMDQDRLEKAVKSHGRSIISELLKAQIEVYLAIWLVFYGQFWLGLMCCAKPFSLIQIFMTVCAQSWHPEKLCHVSFHIKGLAAHAKTRHVFHHSTEGQPEELGSAMMSCITIYSIKQFDYRVVCPLHTLLSKIYLCYELFPSLNSCFTIFFNYFSLFLCFLSATNQQHFHFYLTWFYYKNPCT